MASEIKVDTVSEKTSGSGVTIDGLLIKDGGISGDVSLIGTTPTFTIGDAGAEDAALVFDGNAQDFYIALDDSADDLVIGLGSTVGTTPAISINSDRDVTISDGAIDFDIASHDTSNGLKLGGTLVTATAAELNIMDGVTATAAEINLIYGGTARGTTAIADGDGVLINDAGTMRQTTVETLKTYIGGSQWALISTTTVSNDAKVEIRGLNDSDYFQFLLILDRVIPASDDVGMRILLENSANNNFGAYNYAILGYDDGGDEQRANGGNNSVINAVGGVGSDSGEEGVSGNIYIDNPSAQSMPTIQFHFTVMDKDGDIRVVVGSGQVKDDSEDANGMQIDFTSGNMESGTIKLYGLKAS